MRCDYPMGYDEDYLEPACELFLQLFLQNAQIAVNEEFSQDGEGTVNADFGGYESDDNFSFPSLHTISDGSVSSGSSIYGDGGQDLIVDAITSHFVENFSENSFNLSENEESYSPENDTVGVQQIDDENTDILSEIHESSSTINSRNSDDISNVVIQESHDCENILSNETSLYQEISVQTDVFSHNITSTASTHVSLYVVVPPADSSHDDVSSDTLLSSATPINSSSPSLVMSDNGNNLFEHESLHISNKICDNSEGTASDSSATCSSFSVSKNDRKHQLSDLDSASDIENSDSSENIVDFDENSHPECITFDTTLSEETIIHKDGNINCDDVSDKSVPNLKRKVVSSVDDVLNKVPKYSLSHESNESFNEVSLDNYCKEFSSDIERAAISEEDSINILPSTASAGNVILSSQKTIENSVAEQQKEEI